MEQRSTSEHVAEFIRTLQQAFDSVTPKFLEAGRAISKTWTKAFNSCQQCGRIVRRHRGKFPRRCHCGDPLIHARQFDLLAKGKL